LRGAGRARGTWIGPPRTGDIAALPHGVGLAVGAGAAKVNETVYFVCFHVPDGSRGRLAVFLTLQFERRNLNARNNLMSRGAPCKNAQNRQAGGVGQSFRR
jgi:hypothetical protein